MDDTLPPQPQPPTQPPPTLTSTNTTTSSSDYSTLSHTSNTSNTSTISKNASGPSAPSLGSSTFFPKNDIVEFIHQESLSKKTQSNQVIIETYSCTLWKGFFDMKHKLRDIAELDTVHAVDMGIQLIDNLFWIIYHYSSNVQLTLFLTERGRLLYTEFLYMSRTHQLMKELNTFPSIQDGFQFAIKKSIGSLTCDHHTTNMQFDHISSYRSTFRRLFQILTRNYLVGTQDETPWTDDQINITLHRLNHRMSFAVHQHVTLFEHCVYGGYDKTLSLTGFLLMLQLLADVSMIQQRLNTTTVSNTISANCAHSASVHGSGAAIWDETVVRAVFVFIHDHRSYIDVPPKNQTSHDTPTSHTQNSQECQNSHDCHSSSLDCLEKGHMVQHKWTLYRAVVLQKIQEIQDELHQHTNGCPNGGSGENGEDDDSSSVQATQGSTGTAHGSTTLSDSLGSLSDFG